MFDREKLNDVLKHYKRDFVSFIWNDKDYKRWNEEKFKWEAVKCFQDHWNVNADDFPQMLKSSLAKTSSLLLSANNFPGRMIVKLAQSAPEEVRAMFIGLYDESKDVYERINAFKQQSAVMLKEHGNGAKNHFQTENAITTYLWLRYPDKYYIYKFGLVQSVAEKLGADCQIIQGAFANNIRSFLKLYDEICDALKEDTELVELFRANLSDACYLDPELKTLTVDLGFYISNFYEERIIKKETSSTVLLETNAHQTPVTTNTQNKECRYWMLRCYSDFQNMIIGEVKAIPIEAYCHPILSNNYFEAHIGDLVVCINSQDAVVGIGKILDKRRSKYYNYFDNFVTKSSKECIFIKKIIELNSSIGLSELKNRTELTEMQLLQIDNYELRFLTLSKDEFNCILDMIRDKNPDADVDVYKSSFEQVLSVLERKHEENSFDNYTKQDFLSEVYMTEERYNALTGVLQNKLNIILQGAPGVGKTFAARRLAWSMMGEKDDSRIEFVQFHQNYSYEDFMMGYKPAGDSFELKYGIFYRFCQRAANQPDKPFFFIIDEINRGNMSKIFGELLMLIEKDYRGTKATLAYNGMQFSVPKNLYIIGMMNTADRSLAMIDYALRRRFSFFDVEPGFDSQGFIEYQNSLHNDTLNALIATVKALNNEIAMDKSLGKGFCIGHSYFCGREDCTEEWLRAVVNYDILPMLREYWFDETDKLQTWENKLRGVFQS